jgi:hypothetical protein
MLLPASTRFGEDYSLLANTYEALAQQRMLELMHVSRLVGGVVTLNFHSGRGSEVFRPVPAAKQAEAVRFLTTEGLITPKGLMDPAVLNRISATGAISRATALGRTIISSLLSESRLRRVQDNEAANGSAAYTLSRLMADMRAGLWKELAQQAPAVDIYRRELQRAYLSNLDRKVNGSESDVRPLARENLRLLAKEIDRSLPRAKDEMTRLHLVDSRKQIERILDGKTAARGGGGGFSILDLLGAKNGIQGHGCFSRSDSWRYWELDPEVLPKELREAAANRER